ncbi:IS5 family transposase [Mesorhizobium sp. M0244]|uniref:IS5 family transposase n=1 Tax=Mesorhizobium sp. M0244 TaxID=2956926 RepID=UPI00333A15E5
MPDEYGKWNSVFRRYRRWVATGVFDALLETLAEMVERDATANMIDSTVVRAHHCAVGIKRGLRKLRRLADRAAASPPNSMRGATEKAKRPTSRLFLTPGQAHDIQGFGPLFRMIADRIEALLADKGYDSDAIREEIAKAGVQAVIPAKSNRRALIPHDREKYRWRNLVERLFNKLKNWRHIATRYDKTKESYLGFVALASIKLAALCPRSLALLWQIF